MPQKAVTRHFIRIYEDRRTYFGAELGFITPRSGVQVSPRYLSSQQLTPYGRPATGSAFPSFYVLLVRFRLAVAGDQPHRPLPGLVAGVRVGVRYHRCQEASTRTSSGRTLDFDKPLSTRMVQKIVKKWAGYSRLGDLSPHDLRRAAITRAFDSGPTYRQVQMMSKHKDLKTVMRYDHGRENLDQSAVNFLGYDGD